MLVDIIRNYQHLGLLEERRDNDSRRGSMDSMDLELASAATRAAFVRDKLGTPSLRDVLNPVDAFDIGDRVTYRDRDGQQRQVTVKRVDKEVPYGEIVVRFENSFETAVATTV